MSKTWIILCREVTRHRSSDIESAAAGKSRMSRYRVEGNILLLIEWRSSVFSLSFWVLGHVMVQTSTTEVAGTKRIPQCSTMQGFDTLWSLDAPDSKSTWTVPLRNSLSK